MEYSDLSACVKFAYRESVYCEARRYLGVRSPPETPPPFMGAPIRAACVRVSLALSKLLPEYI